MVAAATWLGEPEGATTAISEAPLSANDSAEAGDRGRDRPGQPGAVLTDRHVHGFQHLLDRDRVIVAIVVGNAAGDDLLLGRGRAAGERGEKTAGEHESRRGQTRPATVEYGRRGGHEVALRCCLLALIG